MVDAFLAMKKPRVTNMYKPGPQRTSTALVALFARQTNPCVCGDAQDDRDTTHARLCIQRNNVIVIMRSQRTQALPSKLHQFAKNGRSYQKNPSRIFERAMKAKTTPNAQTLNYQPLSFSKSTTQATQIFNIMANA